MTPTTLYRLYDGDGDLLYVGIAGNPGRRFEQHRKDKPWWRSVAITRLEHFDTREEAMAAELEAIRAENPRHNIVGRRTPATPTDTHVGQRVYTRRATRVAGTARYFCHDRWGQDRTSDELHLVWEADYAAVSDDFYTTDDPHDVFDRWISQVSQKYGEWVPIYWWVDGFNTFEAAPFSHHILFDHDFLSFFTWPEDAAGEPVNWLSLPIDNAKSWFIPAATGWTPSPYQPSVSLDVLRMAANAQQGHKTRRAPLIGGEWARGGSAA